VKAIWSFWTKPHDYRRLTWLNERHHLLAWALSLGTVRQHYQHTTLHTDTPGKKLLVDAIGLEFENVSIALDALGECDPAWWGLAKLDAYRSQTEPFIHFDNDTFLWRRLPERIEFAQVLAQNPEDFFLGTSYYTPEKFDQVLDANQGWVPEEWKWYGSIGPRRRAACCGVFGGNNLDFIRHYANTAFAMAEHPRNCARWACSKKENSDNLLFEQYLLSACINYHRGRADSPFRSIDIHYLFRDWDEALCSGAAAELGYTHLIGGAKRDLQVAERLEKRVEREYPECYERILEATQKENRR
jgi:hypothetical protein